MSEQQDGSEKHASLFYIHSPVMERQNSLAEHVVTWLIDSLGPLLRAAEYEQLLVAKVDVGVNVTPTVAFPSSSLLDSAHGNGAGPTILNDKRDSTTGNIEQ